jgi:hypothetical protein
MRRIALPLAVLVLALGLNAGTHTQQPLPIDGVVRLLLRLEQVMQAGRPEAYMDLLSSLANRDLSWQAARELVGQGITRAVIRERDRGPLEGTLPGDGYRIMVEVFTERGAEARIVTWRLDIRRVSTGTSDDEWRIAGQQRLSTIEGLSRLSLNPARQYRVHSLVVRADDLSIRLDDGWMFVSETAEGPTAAVLLPAQGGTIRFRPAPETEREQVRIYAGSDTIDTRFEGVFVRFSPFDFRQRFPPEALTPEPPDPAMFRRADGYFRQDVARSFGLDLADLSRETWSLTPQQGDLLAEMHTRRFQTLTYAKVASDAEDISLFNRQRRRNISVYPSAERLAAGVRQFEEAARAPYEVTHYELDVSFDPERQWLDGRARLRLRVTANAIGNFTLRLAEQLTVRSIYASEFGRLLALRVRGQNNVIVNLNGFVTRGTDLDVVVSYSGRLAPAPPEHEVAAPQYPPEQRFVDDMPAFAGEPSLLYSTQTYWYPQSMSGSYATANMHLTVPEPYAVAASGELVPGSPVVVPSQDRQPAGHLYSFEARQPVRYLACLITRLVRVSAREVSLVQALASLATRGPASMPADVIAPGVFNNELNLTIEANPRQTARGRSFAQPAADAMEYYTSLIGDCPYPDLTVALVEKDLPGGHSPAYLAVLNQPLLTGTPNWNSDPAAFPDFPDFFLAHEAAHQWWGQAVGWRSYHDQWISEGFAQYLAALFARRSRGDALFSQMLRRMARWARDAGEAGPVSLGYRLGHIQGDSRIFRAVVYNKSASVLHMLRRILGDEVFFRGVRRLYFGSRFRKAGTEDVRKAFERESGRSLEAFFGAWIDGSGTPRVAVSWAPVRDAAPAAAALRVEQRGKVFEFPVTATVRYATGAVQDVQVVVRDRVSEFALPVTGAVKEITLNRDGFTPLDVERR